MAAMWLSRYPSLEPCPRAVPGSVVAIALPARNEAASIGACIRALDVAAADVVGSTVHLVLLVNNSSDGTAEIARSQRPSALRMTVVEITLPPRMAHAGEARRQAFEHAAARLPSGGVLMTTDADSRVDPRWITANLVELAAGADAVAGVVAFDEAVRATLPPMPLRALEWRLAELHARLGTLIDPRAHDPWPNHILAWGASLALTVAAYRRVGGLPSIPLAEDRALAAAIERADLRLRHSHKPVVFTSARHQGRAPGGFADLLRRYASGAATPCDAALEPTADLLRRLRWRTRLRRIAAGRGLAAAATAADRLGFDGKPAPCFSAPCFDAPGFDASGFDAPGFGALWTEIEAQCPTLKRKRVVPATLGAEVALAERVVSRIERRAAGRVDRAVSAFAA